MSDTLNAATCTTLKDQLRLRAAQHPNKFAYTFLINGEEEEGSLTYAQLDRHARAIAARLQSITQSKERVLILLPSSLEYVTAFFGAIYAGMIPVPAYPPRPNHRSTPRVKAIIDDAAATLIISTRKILMMLAEQPDLQKSFQLLHGVAIDEITLDSASNWINPILSADDIAYLQYTSGSTSMPKGVMVTHANLLHNARITQAAWQNTANDIIVGWLPLHHDLGLIANVLQTLYSGTHCILFSPAAFVQKPFRWLQLISHYRATISGAPNFAYDLCVEKITLTQAEKLNLTSWKIAFNAAEPVRAETIDRFSEKFSAYGFERSAFYSCYGLAETALFTSGGSREQLPLIQTFDAYALEKKSVKLFDDGIPRTLVACGRPLGDQEIVIADPITKMRCPDNVIGEIWLAGPSVTKGYWNRPEQTQQTFGAYLVGTKTKTARGPFLRTGDLGFLHQGEIFIAGRYKDIIIIHGRNHYPQDIEFTVENAHPALDQNNSAAICIEDQSQEKLVIIQSIKRTAINKFVAEEVMRAIREAVTTEHDVAIHDIVFIKPGSIFKTSSGKIQRNACRKAYLDGSIADIQITTPSEKTNIISPPPSKHISADELQQWLMQTVARLCNVTAESIHLTEAFTRYGLDSMRGVELSELLSTFLGKSLSPTLVYDFPSIDKVVTHFTAPEKKETISLSTTNITVAPTTTSTPAAPAVAIIGIGCRFPGAANTQAYWNLLCEGRDAIISVPANRQWKLDGLTASDNEKTAITLGGFLETIADFDPQFFGISPREAISMDPQQRLFLEVAWEALEDASITAQQLAGSATAVYVGISSQEYNKLLSNAAIDAADHLYTGTGTALSIAANRLSYLFDLRGPSMAIDTACSSSLTAIHQACQSILHGEATLAIAGGVNLLLTPERSLQFAKMNFLARDGRCKSFDARANGYVRSEGAGVVILKLLAQAEADGDDIYAVIAGSAINQDGRTNGLTAPNQYSQENVLRAAYQEAGIAPTKVQYIEAHGTGTALGDPIEVKALGAVLSEARNVQQAYCQLGSVKANIGHLEAAAGVAGLIKLALMLKHKKIPPQIHFQQPNPHIPFQALPFRIATQLTPWETPPPQHENQLIGGVSSFGFGGTNAHIVLTNHHATTAATAAITIEKNEKSAQLFLLSARHLDALKQLAQQWQQLIHHLEKSISLSDICYHAALRRTHHNERCAIIAENRDDLLKQLQIFTDHRTATKTKIAKSSHKIVWVFAGQGNQWPQMTVSLFDQPIFYDMLTTCNAILKKWTTLDIIAELQQPAATSRLDQSEVIQPVMTALQIALGTYWLSGGIKPDAIVGHSLGEMAAAHFAGILTLEDALLLAYHRGRIVQALTGQGKMLAVKAAHTELEKIIFTHGYEARINIAAINSPLTTILSGEVSAISELKNIFDENKMAAVLLPGHYGFHSEQMQTCKKELVQALATLTPRESHTPFYSTLLGKKITREKTKELDAHYWGEQLCHPVLFAPIIDNLLQQQFNIFMEISPQPVLLNAIHENAHLQQRQPLLIATLQRDHEAFSLLLALSELYVAGLTINWAAIFTQSKKTQLFISLPTYPWQRQRYWISDTQPAKGATMSTEKNMPSQEQHEQDILAQLKQLLSDLMRIAPANIDVDVPLLEMGADSIILVSAIKKIETTFHVKVAIRQFFGELKTLNLLAKYIIQQHPEKISACAVTTNATEQYAPTMCALTQTEIVSTTIEANSAKTYSAVHAAAANQDLQGIIQQQLQLMSQQLALLQGAPVAIAKPTSTTATSAAVSPVTMTPITATPTKIDSIEKKSLATITPFKSEKRLKVSAWQTQSAQTNARNLSQQQKQHLENLIQQFTEKTKRSKEMTQAYRAYLADSKVTVGFRLSTKEMLYPIIGKRTAGARLWDIDDNEYCDISMGFGVHLFGYRPAFLTNAIQQYAQEGIDLGPRSTLVGDVAKLITEFTGLERVAFCNSGTEAVMTAIRLARATTGRTKIALFKHSYHGHSDYTLAEAQMADENGNLVSITPGLPTYILNDVLVLDYGAADALEKTKQHQHELAAVLVEPVQSRQPDLQPREFLQNLRKLTQQLNIVLIFDEMITGFRVHPGGAQAWFGVKADIATYGKILGGSIPIGVVAGSAKYLDGIDGGMWQYGDDSYPGVERTFFGGTFCQHPLALMTAHATLTYLKQQGPSLQENLNKRTAQFANELNHYFNQENLPIQLIYFASLFRFAHDGNLDLFFYHLIKKGVYIWEWRNCFLSTAHTDADLAFVIQAVKETINELRIGGYLPKKEAMQIPQEKHKTTSSASAAIATDAQPLGFWGRHQIKPSLLQPASTHSTFTALTSAPPKIEFSLYYFGAYPAEFAEDKYQLILESARFADQADFKALWIPERHFHEFGGFSPNPSVICAALARETQRIHLRAGSVVLPLHHPIRVAEEWAVVDNLSRGRVGIAFASGWHSDDFVFAPEKFGQHREWTFENIQTIHQLWQGETIVTKGGSGQDVPVKLFPQPQQTTLPSWITIVNNPETYVKAGELGFGILTNLMGQSVEDLTKNIAQYRQALQQHGHAPQKGHVVVLLHTFIGEEFEEVRETARVPFCNYLKSSFGLFKNLAKIQGLDVDWENLASDDMTFLLNRVYERYIQSSALIGTPQTCAPLVKALAAAGVDEIACFIDFGIASEIVLPHLPHLQALKSFYQPAEIVEFPTNSVQKSRWRASQTHEATLCYTLPTNIQLQGELNVAALQQAIQTLMDRHAAFRTTYTSPGHIQRVHPPYALPVPLIDYAEIEDALKEKAINHWLQQEAETAFDLAKDPCLRAHILKIAEHTHLLALTVHHIAADGLAIAVMLEEIMEIYRAYCLQQTPNLSTPMQFADYTYQTMHHRWQAIRTESDRYWLSEFSVPAQPLALPYDFPYIKKRYHVGGREMVLIDHALMQEIKKYSRSQHTTLLMTLLAIFQLFLYRLTQQQMISITIATSGRYITGSETMIGGANSILPNRVEIDPQDTFLEYLHYVKEKMLQAYEHEIHSGSALLEKIAYPAKPFPLSNVAFLIDPGLSINKFHELQASWFARPVAYVDYELFVNFFEVDDQYWLEFSYSNELFKCETMQAWMMDFQDLLQEIINAPHQPITQLLAKKEIKEIKDTYGKQLTSS